MASTTVAERKKRERRRRQARPWEYRDELARAVGEAALGYWFGLPEASRKHLEWVVARMFREAHDAAPLEFQISPKPLLTDFDRMVQAAVRKGGLKARGV
ncbi:hypothetical protein [Azospirillum largimobile]